MNLKKVENADRRYFRGFLFIFHFLSFSCTESNFCLNLYFTIKGKYVLLNVQEVLAHCPFPGLKIRGAWS